MIHLHNTITLAIYSGVLTLVIGLIAFIVNWNTYGGGMLGYKILLFPGNLTLIHIWHPLFTEELGFWPKLALLLLGQFSVVAAFVALTTAIFRRL